MPPKRKALAETTSNVYAPGETRNSKAAKKSAQSTASTSSVPTSTVPTSPAPCPTNETASKPFKYSNANTPSKKPSYVNLQWPNIGEFLNDEDQDMPKVGEKLDGWCDRVSDLGIPVSEYAVKICKKMTAECEKRDQNVVGMYIYNDWTGWGISEVMENHLSDFNRDIFKKTMSPYQKFAYVEAFACFILMEHCLVGEWMGNENGPGISEIVDMIGVMVLTSLEMLAEHNLLKPNSDVKNLNIVCLILLDFLNGGGRDLDCEWDPEVVRLFDEAGIALENDVRKQLSVTKEQIRKLRASYIEKASDFDDLDDFDQGGDHAAGNVYEAFARKHDWTPEDDGANNVFGCRLWYRWDWKAEYPEFKKNHPGGTHYVIGKMSKAAKKKHML